MTTAEGQSARRPLATRAARWPHMIAARLVALGLRPNQVSLLSIAFALGAGIAMIAAPVMEHRAGSAALFVAAAVLIQFRLLCNLLDGLMAVEGGLRTKSGEVYNELPDRFADVAVFLGAGYAIGTTLGVALGWAAACVAVLTAYVRAMGAAAGASQQFIGPMAKPHRMALMTAACIAAAFEIVLTDGLWSFTVTLGIVILGGAATVARRTIRIVRELEAA